MCQLFETICIENGVVKNLVYHQQRVNRLASHTLIDYIIRLDLPRVGTHRLRIDYTPTHIIQHTITPYIPQIITSLRLVMVEDNFQYAHKWADRSPLEGALAQKSDADEILIVRNGLITDTSFSNVLFLDGKQWVTPAEPLLAGTCRARLLHQRRIEATSIRMEELGRFSHFMLINAMRDFDLTQAIPLTVQSIRI
jgi:4-amino-4-deoxychorismate lyase